MDKVERYKDSLKYFEDLKKLREREDLDSLSDFFRSMTIRPTEEELKKPIPIDDSIERQLENTPGVGRELTEEELYQKLSQQQPEETTVEDFGGVTKAIEEAKQRTAEEPKIEPLGTPTKQQIIDANTPRLGDEINLVKKRESVGDINYLQKGKTETENVEEKDTDATTNLLTDDYYNTQYGIEKFKKYYDIHNPLSLKGQKTKPRQEEWNKKTLKKWQTTKVTPMVTNTIDAIFPAFKNELERHGIYSRDFGTKLAITESAAGTNLIGYKNGKPVDFGMFQINAKNLNKIFNTDAFENSFKKYWGPNAVKAVGNISADQLKEMYNNDPQKFLERITNDHKLNLAIALAGVIVPNLDARMPKKQEKQSGGRVESNPYKKQPRFI
jgi:hypothetical protein